jgi:hypothetical protein
MTDSSSGTIGCSERELLLVQQDDGVFQLGGHLVGVGHEIGRQVAAVELHALDHVGLGLEALVLFDGDHASLPTFCIASAIWRPISASPLAEIVPTWATSSESVTSRAAALIAIRRPWRRPCRCRA